MYGSLACGTVVVMLNQRVALLTCIAPQVLSNYCVHCHNVFGSVLHIKVTFHGGTKPNSDRTANLKPQRLEPPISMFTSCWHIDGVSLTPCPSHLVPYSQSQHVQLVAPTPMQLSSLVVVQSAEMPRGDVPPANTLASPVRDTNLMTNSPHFLQSIC